MCARTVRAAETLALELGVRGPEEGWCLRFVEGGRRRAEMRVVYVWLLAGMEAAVMEVRKERIVDSWS